MPNSAKNAVLLQDVLIEDSSDENFNKAVLFELISNPVYQLKLEGPQKTLIFAASDFHADQIVRILREEYDEMGQEVDVDAIKKITEKGKEKNNRRKTNTK